MDVSDLTALTGKHFDRWELLKKDLGGHCNEQLAGLLLDAW